MSTVAIVDVISFPNIFQNEFLSLPYMPPQLLCPGALFFLHIFTLSLYCLTNVVGSTIEYIHFRHHTIMHALLSHATKLRPPLI